MPRIAATTAAAAQRTTGTPAPATPPPVSAAQIRYISGLLKERDHQTCIPGVNSRPLDLSKCDALQLTGGRNGTASELIGWLTRRPRKVAA